MEKREVFGLLAKQFKTPQEVVTEIINLQAILNLPKGTEHFLSDLHGESETFLHILRNASGVIRTKIDLAFGSDLSEGEKNDLAALIYYPERVLKKYESAEDKKERYAEILIRLIEVTKLVAAKYTRSKVRKALPKDYQYIIDELINMPHHSIDKKDYYNHIISSIIELGNAENFICEMCRLIQRLAIDHLHIVGDIFDRGNGADRILDSLSAYHSFDIEWGNHDVLWMGAHFGNEACVCNIIRINCAYRNLSVIERGYGINLRPLVTFALEEYATDDCSSFAISDVFGGESDFEKNSLLAKMTKAITVIQLKIENALIRRHREFFMDDRILYPSSELTAKERALIDLLVGEFKNNARLDDHVNLLLKKGSMYRVFNGNLLMHGCVPTEKDGTFSSVVVGDKFYEGKALYDRLDALVRQDRTGGKGPVLRICKIGKLLSESACRIRRGREIFGDRERAHAREGEGRRASGKRKRKTYRDRRRSFQSLSRQNGHRGIYADQQLAGVIPRVSFSLFFDRRRGKAFGRLKKRSSHAENL